MCVSTGRCNSPPARLSPTTSVCNNDKICQETWKKKLPINQSINLLFIKYIQRPLKVFFQNQKEKPTDPFGASMTRQWPGKKNKKFPIGKKPGADRNSGGRPELPMQYKTWRWRQGAVLNVMHSLKCEPINGSTNRTCSFLFFFFLEMKSCPIVG